jgi:hypothetical protein
MFRPIFRSSSGEYHYLSDTLLSCKPISLYGPVFTMSIYFYNISISYVKLLNCKILVSLLVNLLQVTGSQGMTKQCGSHSTRTTASQTDRQSSSPSLDWCILHPTPPGSIHREKTNLVAMVMLPPPTTSNEWTKSLAAPRMGTPLVR